jgi:hypothetical protein
LVGQNLTNKDVMGRFTTAPGSRNSGMRAPDRKPDCRLRYGGPWFSAASALPLDGSLTRPRNLARLMAAAVRRPRRLMALIALLAQTPREYVVVSGSCTGQALHRYFNQRRLGIFTNRLCRGVLLLPDDHADYLRGRRRHALRTNLRRAAAAGIRCEVMRASRRARYEVSVVVRRQLDHLPEAELHAWTDHFRELVTRSEMTVMVARDQEGGALAVLAATIDDSVCAIRFAMATCHEARWALHDHLVRTLIARRVRYLLAADDGPFGALAYSTKVQHYQHVLGYELRHLIPARARPATRKRRIVASVAVAAAASVSIVVPPAAASTSVRTSLALAIRTPSHVKCPGSLRGETSASLPQGDHLTSTARSAEVTRNCCTRPGAVPRERRSDAPGATDQAAGASRDV